MENGKLMFQCLNVSMFKCLNVSISQCLNVSMSQYLNLFPIPIELCRKFVDDSRIEKQDSDFPIFIQRGLGKIHTSKKQYVVIYQNHFGMIVIFLEFPCIIISKITDQIIVIVRISDQHL